MRPLDRILISDLRRMWGQGLAICAVLACGIGTSVMATSSMRSLEATRDAFYEEYRFGDVFVQVVRAPNEVANRIAQIPGVDRVQTRVVRDVVLDIPGMIEPASCRLVSLTNDPETSLNGVYLRRGRMPDPDARGEVLASERFAEANGWIPGDEVQVIMGGIKQRLQIVGVATSPEYIYAVQPGQMLSDDRRFGILWMPYRQMAAAFNMEGAFNDATLRVRADASVPEVILHVDRLTQRYGGIGAYDRDDQMSNRRVSDEMHQLQGTALVTPSIFLAVGVFLFNIVLSRLVHQQQEQIATLRAFGYGKWEIGWHYIKFVLVLVAIGAVAGCVAGVWLAEWITGLMVRFFQFPVVYHRFAVGPAAVVVAISLAGALLGSGSAVRRAILLQPAVAMRPEAPRRFGPSLAERIGLARMLSPITRMVLRRLERNLRSTSLSILGMALGVAVLVVGTFMEDSIDFVLDAQFQRAQRQDIILTFTENASVASIHNVHQLPGVRSAEPFRAVAVRLLNGRNERRSSIMALPEYPQLFRVLDEDGNAVELAGSGVTISEKLAELLDVTLGDEIVVELMEGQRGRHAVRVVAIFPDYAEPSAYINLDELHRLLGEGPRYSGAFVRSDMDRMPNLLAMLKDNPAVAGIIVKQAVIQNYKDTIAASTRPMRVINATFAFIIAFGVIYNCALITLAERSRDLATLRVMGFKRWEVATVLLGELAAITLAAIPVGLPVGCTFAWIATSAMDTETHRIPLVLTRTTLGYAVVVILVSAIASSLLVRRMLDKLDLIAVLKVKE